MSRLTRLHIFLIMGALLLLVGLIWYFTGITKAQEAINAQQARIDAAQPDADKLQANKADLARAARDADATLRSYGAYEARYMPIIDLYRTDVVSRTYTWVKLIQLPSQLAREVEAFMGREQKRENVQASWNGQIAPIASDPRNLPDNVIVVPLGPVTATGTFNNINRFFRSWRRFERLAVVDGYNLTSQNGVLSGTANVTIYIFPQSPSTGVRPEDARLIQDQLKQASSTSPTAGRLPNGATAQRVPVR
jgi:hypothetical protein